MLERPRFEQLLRNCRDKKVDTVLITDVDRLARNTLLVTEALNAFGHWGIRVRFVNENRLEFFWTILRAIPQTRT